MSGIKVTSSQLLKLGDAIYKKAIAVPYADENRGYLGGSEISGCIRRTVAKHLNMPQTHPRSKVASRRLELGHIVEAWVVEDFLYGIGDSKKVRLTHTGENQFNIIPESAPIQLHPDGLFSINESGSWEAVAWLEIKSAGEKSLKRQSEEGLYPEYIGQAIGEMHYGKAKMVLFHVAQVDKLESYFQRVVPYDKGAGEWFDYRANHIHDLIDAEELPEGEPTSLCQFCPFQGACRASGRNRWRNAPVETQQELIKPTQDAAEKVREYMNLNARKKSIEGQMKALREYIEVNLSNVSASGYDLSAESTSCRFTKPSIKRKLNIDKVLQNVPADILAECYSEEIVPPSLRIAEIKSKKEPPAKAISLAKASGSEADSTKEKEPKGSGSGSDSSSSGQGELMSLFMVA